jgi:molybdopterin biosynthesis enzyme
MHKGDVVSAARGDLGTLLSCGIRKVAVYRDPKIAVMSTGNEIIGGYTG